MAGRSLNVGTIKEVSGEVNIAGGDLYKGYTAEQVSALLTQITTSFQPKPFDGRCPYKGLDDFEEEDAGLFFGRERLVEGLVHRLKDSRSLFITGPSGSGKSSLVRAGLFPAWKRGALKELHSEHWLYEMLKPGREPLEALALAFSRLKSPELASYFRQHVGEPSVLNQCAESCLSERKDQRFVLFIDQFEEVFTPINREEERLIFLNLLTHAVNVENGRVILVFAMRSDFVSNCAAYPELNALLNRQSAFAQIGSMRPDELVRAIAQPALCVGLRVDPELVAQIIHEMQGEPGALPLMQFALKDLFDVQQGKGGVIALTLEDYLRQGGIRYALERHADGTFAQLNESEQALARSIFSGLIEIRHGTQDTRRTALFDELVPADGKADEVLRVVQKLADARLVITDAQTGQDTVTLSHEALIDAWHWLRKLVDENREAIALQNEIAADAKEWDDRGRDPSYLYSGARLLNAREQLKTKRLTLSGLAEQFIQAGRAKQKRGQFILVGGTAGIIALLLLAVIIFIRQSSANAHLAQQNAEIANTAQAASMLANSQQMTAQANADEAAKQTKIALARQLAAQAQSIYAADAYARQTTGVLLAVQTMRLYPLREAADVLQNQTLARPVASLVHDNAVYAVAFSPDGKYVVSGGWDETARVWEAFTGREIARLNHEGSVRSVVFSPDGKYIVSGSSDHTVRVWVATTGKELSRMLHDDYVISVAFSPDGRYIVSGSWDNTARVWEASTGREVARMTHDHDVTSVAFSSDGKYVVSGSRDRTARVWETTTGREVARMADDVEEVLAVTISPDGKYVATGGCYWEGQYCMPSTARVWQTFTGQEVASIAHNEAGITSVAFSPNSMYMAYGGADGHVRLWAADGRGEIDGIRHDNSVYSVAFSPDSQYVVSGSRDGTARVWEAATGREVARIVGVGEVNSVAFSPDGKYVVSGSSDHIARVWTVFAGPEVVQVRHEEEVHRATFSPDGRYVVSGSGNTARVWETTRGNEVSRMTHQAAVYSLAFSPDGRYVASSGGTIVRVWEAATGQEIARMVHDSHVSSVNFSRDGRYVLSIDYQTARVWEALTGREIARVAHAGDPNLVAFSPDGNYVVSADREGTARVWEAATSQEVAHMIHDSYVYSVAFSPDGKYMVSGSSDKTARVWEASTGREVARMIHGKSVDSAAFSPDGKYVLTTSGEMIRVWEVATGQQVAHMAQNGIVRSVAFSRDSKYALSISCDNGNYYSCALGSVHIWDVVTGQEIARMSHDSYVNWAAFSPDGKYFVSASRDRTARVWLWQPKDLISDACSRVPRNLTYPEWYQYIGKTLRYQAVCPNLPLEPEPDPSITQLPNQ